MKNIQADSEKVEQIPGLTISLILDMNQ